MTNEDFLTRRVEALEECLFQLVSVLLRRETDQDGKWGHPSFTEVMNTIAEILPVYDEWQERGVRSKLPPIPKGYAVHHINGDLRDNRLENIRVVPTKSNR